MTWKNGLLFLTAAVIVAGGVVLSNRESVQGQNKGGMQGQRELWAIPGKLTRLALGRCFFLYHLP